MKNIFAHTPHEYETHLPPYISINKLDSGAYTISVRTVGQNYTSVIEMSFMEMLKMQSAILSIVSFGDDDD